MGTPLKDRETFFSQGIESNIACSICDGFLTGEDRTRPSYCFRIADEFFETKIQPAAYSPPCTTVMESTASRVSLNT